jgi:hypothetical protein
MGDLSPNDDYGNDFDELSDSFADDDDVKAFSPAVLRAAHLHADAHNGDAGAQLSPVSEAPPPTTPMSPRDEASLDAREEFIRRWREKEEEAEISMRQVDLARKPIDRALLPPPPLPEPVRAPSGEVAAAREEARQLRDQLFQLRQRSVGASTIESPQVAQLLRERERFVEEVAAKDSAVAALETSLRDSEKKVVFLEAHLSKLDSALETLHRDVDQNASDHNADADAASAASPVAAKPPVEADTDDVRADLDIARAALQGAEAREKEVRDERDKALQRCASLVERATELEAQVAGARTRAREAIEARLGEAGAARLEGEASATADERVAMLGEELDRARADSLVYAAAAARDAARDGVDLRDVNDDLAEKLEASQRIQAMAESRAETAREALDGQRQASQQATEVNAARIVELEEQVAIAEGLHAASLRQLTERTQEVDKVQSTSKALGSEADDTRKQLEDLVREKNELVQRVAEAEQASITARREGAAAIQKVEDQLRASEGRVLGLERDAAEKTHADIEVLPAGAGAAKAAHEDRLAAAALRADAAADRALAQAARSEPRLLEPRGYEVVEAAAAPEHAVSLDATEARQALEVARARAADTERAARDDRAAAAAHREAAEQDRNNAARDRSNAAQELVEARAERFLAAERGRADAQASGEDVRKLAWRIVGRVTRRHSQNALRHVFAAWSQKRVAGRMLAVLGVAVNEAGRRGRKATLQQAWRRFLINKPPAIEVGDLADPEERKRRAEAAYRRASKAAEAAKAARGDLDQLNREEADASRAIVFRRAKDAPGDVVGLDGQEICSAFQFGGCPHQGQTGLVVHQKANGETQWLWHACVACARDSGCLRTHARFGDVRSCPLASDVARPCATKPLGDSNRDASDRLLKHREDLIRRYAGERDDLMAALGAALTNLHSMGASYPRWVWDRYERGRTASATLTYNKI